MDPEFLAHPTYFLPPLIRLSTKNVQEVSQVVQKLRVLYRPPKRPPLPSTLSLPKRSIERRIHDKSVPDSGYASAEGDDDDDLQESIKQIADPEDGLEVIRTDLFERAFVVKWITGFVTRSDLWIGLATSKGDHNARTQILDNVISLLPAFNQNEDNNDHDVDDVILRSFSFPSPDGSTIDVELNDAPLLDDDHTSVGLQSWGCSIRLGKRLCAAPAEFSLSTGSISGRKKPLRVLELGAGTGLLSIVAAKILCHDSPEIVASDYHPDVIENLTMNVVTSFPLSEPPITVHVLDWESPVYSGPLDRPFDVILAADVIYHPHHARWIKGCVERLLARPDAGNSKGGVFWMMMALRPSGRHEGLDRTVHEMFPDTMGMGMEDGLGVKLAVLQMEDNEKLDGIGRADERGYKLFRIGWIK